MSLKVLILPTMIVLSLVLAIGYIKPNISSILLKQEEIAAQKVSLQAVDSVAASIQSLSQSLAQREETVSFIEKYYPRELDEDRIVDMFNYLAQQSGVVVTEVTLVESPLVRPTPESIDPALIGADGIITPEIEAAAASSIPRSFTANVKVMGAYANIKDFFARVYRADRMHTTQEFSISERTETDKGSQPEETEGASQPNFLVGNIHAVFAYIPLKKTSDILNNPLFKTGVIDFQSAEKIVSFVTHPLPVLQVDNLGRANPFE